MKSQSALAFLMDELAEQLNQLDDLGETIAAAHLDAALCQLTRSIHTSRTATETE